MKKTLCCLLLVAGALVAGAGRSNPEVRTMATKTWLGTAGDGNWANPANWAGGVIPVANDTVIVSRLATYGMTTSLDRSADTAGAGLNLASFEIEKECTISIGSLALPLRLTCHVASTNTGKFVDYGSGELYFSSDTGTGALATDRVIIDKETASKTVYLMGEMVGSASAMTTVEIVKGTAVTLGYSAANTLAITTLYLAPRNISTDVYVTGTIYAAVSGSVYMAGGGFLWDSFQGNTFELSGGELEFRGTSIPVLNQYGGLFIHAGTASNYAVTVYNALGGTMDSTTTGGKKLISTLNQGPKWSENYNPQMVVTTRNYIGG